MKENKDYKKGLAGEEFSTCKTLFLLKINVIIGQYRHRRFSFHTAVPGCGN